MNLPEEAKATIRKMIEEGDPTLEISLERYKDFKYTSESQLERTFDPDRKKIVESKIEFYTELIRYIEEQMQQKKH